MQNQLLTKTCGCKILETKELSGTGDALFLLVGRPELAGDEGDAGGSGVGGAFAAEDEEAAGGERSGEEYEGAGLGCGAGRLLGLSGVAGDLFRRDGGGSRAQAAGRDGVAEVIAVEGVARGELEGVARRRVVDGLDEVDAGELAVGELDGGGGVTGEIKVLAVDGEAEVLELLVGDAVGGGAGGCGRGGEGEGAGPALHAGDGRKREVVGEGAGMEGGYGGEKEGQRERAAERGEETG